VRSRCFHTGESDFLPSPNPSIVLLSPLVGSVFRPLLFLPSGCSRQEVFIRMFFSFLPGELLSFFPSSPSPLPGRSDLMFPRSPFSPSQWRIAATPFAGKLQSCPVHPRLRGRLQISAYPAFPLLVVPIRLSPLACSCRYLTFSFHCPGPTENLNSSPSSTPFDFFFCLRC